MVSKMIFKVGCNEVVAMVVSSLLPKNDWHAGFGARFDQVVGKQLPVLEKLVFFTLTNFVKLCYVLKQILKSIT